MGDADRYIGRRKKDEPVAECWFGSISGVIPQGGSGRCPCNDGNNNTRFPSIILTQPERGDGSRPPY